MDLSALDTISACNKGAEIEIKHPVTKKPTGFFVSLLGTDADVVRAYLDEVNDEAERKAALARRRREDPEVLTSAQQHAKNLRLLAVCTTGWRTADKGAVAVLNGEELAFNAANAIKLYGAIPTIFDQVNAGVAQLENFMPA